MATQHISAVCLDCKSHVSYIVWLLSRYRVTHYFLHKKGDKVLYLLALPGLQKSHWLPLFNKTRNVH